MSKVWLITGSGNGLGRDIAEVVLAARDSVVAGARRTEELAPLVAQHGERVKPVRLEVRDEAAAKAAVQLAVDTFGRCLRDATEVFIHGYSMPEADLKARELLFGNIKPDATINVSCRSTSDRIADEFRSRGFAKVNSFPTIGFETWATS